MFFIIGEPVLEIRAGNLNARQMVQVTTHTEWRLSSAASHHQNRLVSIDFTLEVTLNSEVQIFGVNSKRQGQRLHRIPRHSLLNGLPRECQLLLNRCVIILSQVGMPKGVVPNLKTQRHQLFQLVCFILGLAKELMGLLSFRKNKENRLPSPIRVLMTETDH